MENDWNAAQGALIQIITYLISDIQLLHSLEIIVPMFYLKMNAPLGE